MRLCAGLFTGFTRYCLPPRLKNPRVSRVLSSAGPEGSTMGVLRSTRSIAFAVICAASTGCRYLTIAVHDCSNGDPCRGDASDEEVWVQNPKVPESEAALVSAIDPASIPSAAEERRVVSV